MTTVPTADRAAELLSSPDAESLWSPLKADGYFVEVSPAEAAVSIRVSAGGEACADCLAPAGMLRDIVLLFLNERGVDTDQLTVTVTTPAGH